MALTNSQMLFGTPSAAADLGYQLSNSLRFQSANSCNILYPSKDAPGDKFTLAFWFKPSRVMSRLFASIEDSSKYFVISYNYATDDGKLAFQVNDNNSDRRRVTLASFKDPSSWYHLVVVGDNSKSSATDILKVFVNGKLVSHEQPSSNDWIQGMGFYVGEGNSHRFGANYTIGGNFYNGYLADFHFVDGYCSPSTNDVVDDFGEIDSDTGVWTPLEFDNWPTRTTTQINDGTVWSNTLVGLTNTIVTPANGFDGEVSPLTNANLTYAAGGQKFTPPTAFTNVTSLRTFIEIPGDGYQITLNNAGSAQITGSGSFTGWVDCSSALAALSNTVSAIQWVRPGTGGNVYPYLYAVEINGVILVDSQVDSPSYANGWNNYRRDFSDNSSTSALGKDFGPNGKIANATGGKPILLTTDGYGDVTGGSVDTTDSNKSNLVLAIAGSGSIADVHHTAKGSGTAKTIANDGVTLSTAKSKLYGSSLLFEASNTDSLKVTGDADVAFGTGDFCVEFWVYNTNNKNYNAFVATRSGGSTEDGWVIASNSSGYLYVHSNAAVAGSYSGEHVLPLNKWSHVAYTRASGKHRLYLNGIVAANASTTSRDYTNDDLAIGTNPYDSEEIDSYINDVRIYKGIAKYTSSFFLVPIRNNTTNMGGFVISDGAVTTTDADCKTIYAANADGSTKNSPTAYNTDSNASSLELAVPGDSAASGTCDVHQEINTGSSNKSVTAQGNAATSTTKSKYYGTSIALDGSGDYLEFADSTDWDFGTGDFTVELWIYPTNTSGYVGIIGARDSSGWGMMYAPSDNYKLKFYTPTERASGNDAITVNTWQHVAVSRSGSTIKAFVNGAQVFSHSDSDTANGDASLKIGTGWPSGMSNLNGYIQDVRVYKGAAKYTAAFTLPVTGTPHVVDVLKDSPTSGAASSDSGEGGELNSNYATLNSLKTGSGITLSQGNLYGSSSANAWKNSQSTIAMSSGKWYVEFGPGLNQDSNNNICAPSVCLSSHIATTNISGAGSTNLWYNGALDMNGTQTASWASTYGTSEVVGCALDADTGKVWWSIDGTWQASGNPATGANPAGTLTNTNNESFVFAANLHGSGYVYMNFGQRAFKNEAPAGFKCLCASNIGSTDQTIVKGKEHFDVVTYTGNGGSQSVTGLEFQPALVWAKNRSSALNYHEVHDAARGAAKSLWTNLTGAQTDYSGGSYSLRSFDSNGFTVVDDGAGSYGINGPNGGNYSGTGAYVAWAWAASSVTPSTEGSITPSAQYVNSTTNFSISHYTGTAANATIGHGLSVAPAFIILKFSGSSSAWSVYHKEIGNTKRLRLETTDHEETGYWQSTNPTSTVYSVTGDINDSTTIVSYCFAETEGYCKAGRYIGTGGDNYVNIGFYPRWILIKRSVANSSPDTSTDYTSWAIIDTKRYSYNGLASNHLWANKPQGEGYRGNGSNTSSLGDMAVWPMSNGFYMTGPGSSVNASTGEYVYLAIAEAPFSLARPR